MEQEYLVSYGLLGDFGRFRAPRPLDCGRGDAVVVRSQRGVELGQVLCSATSGHAQFLPNTSVGALLRPATAEDERIAEGLRQRGQELFETARLRAVELGLPMEVIDAEVLLEERAVLHLVRWDECDVRDFVSSLSRRFALHVALEDLTHAEAPAPEAQEHGCGSCGAGGCGSGGCGSGGCASCGTTAADVRAYFAELREKMISRSRTPLL
jgi:cell fate regulator YaaT (PSP1 superfamily)